MKPVANRFRIQNVVIEGFKGFTDRQEISLDGGHAFLLGQNGNGKSSIIEAILWGLFGSIGKSNETVANRNYTGPCEVVVTFIHGEERLKLQRAFRRGAAGRSDALLTDENGKKRELQKIIPQFDSADAGEGMHIIFAPQASPLRRQPEDLGPFERPIFNHLGLTHPRALLSQLDDFLKAQEIEGKGLADKLTKKRQNIDEKISRLERERGGIVGAPPWGSGHIPTIAESEKKSRKIIEEITGRPQDESLSGSSLYALIGKAKDALENRRSQDLGELEKEAEDIGERRKRLEAFNDIQEKIAEQQWTVQGKQSELVSILGARSLNELQNSVREKRAAVNTEDLKRQIAKTASDLLHRNEENPVSCPVCEMMHSRRDLEVLLQQVIEKSSSTATLELNQLKAQLERAENLEREVQSLKSDLDKLERKEETIKAQIDPEDVEDPQERYEQCLGHEDSIKKQIEEHEDWLNEIKRRLSKLEEERRFHGIQKQLTSMKESRKQFERVEESHNDFVAFGESVRSIRQAVANCLTERLKKDIPKVCERLSTAFASLTRHPQYDRLTIVEEKLPKLELQVASSHNLSSHPIGVLNGQSESALALVPYFAFSQVDDASTEMYLVLLDDPTRAFDEEHTETLVKCLAELGKHVQLVVASHETSRFRPLLREEFKLDHIVVEPIGWTPAGGPQLNIERHESCQT